MNKRGFVLLETLLVSTVIIGTLVFIFSQFVNLKNSYDDSFKYNTVKGLYGVKNIEKFLHENSAVGSLTDYIKFKEDLLDVDYISFVNADVCDSRYINQNIYCNELIKKLNVKQIIIANEDLTNLKIKMKKDNPFSEEMRQFINKISIKYNDKYKIIVEYNDNTFAAIDTDF